MGLPSLTLFSSQCVYSWQKCLPFLISFPQADLKGRETFLFSSTPDNIPFYESFGFEVIGEIKLGEDNPKWKKDPVPLPLVSFVIHTKDVSSSPLHRYRCSVSRKLWSKELCDDVGIHACPSNRNAFELNVNQPDLELVSRRISFG